MRACRTVGRAAAIVACLGPVAARAQGFGVNEIGSCAVARAFAGTGAPCDDASAIFWNPAAVTNIPGLSLYAGAATIALGGDFTQDTTAAAFRSSAPVGVPPHAFVNFTLPNRFAFGIGVYVPYGLTSRWGADFPGRFSALRASLRTVYVQPNVAFEFESGPSSFSIGGGPVFAHSTVELRQALDLSQLPAPLPLPGSTTATFGQLGVAPETEFARARIEGNGNGIGFHVGVHARLTPTIEVGARYLSPISFDYRDARATFTQRNTGLILPVTIDLGGGASIPAGTPYDALLQAQFAAGGPLGTQKASTRIKHPGQFEAGIGFRGIPETRVSLDYALIQWSSFDALPLDFSNPATPDRTLLENYENSSSVRGSIEFTFVDGIVGRAGVSWVQSPAPEVTVTPLLPDQDRVNYAIGFGVPLAGRYALDASYLRVDTKGRRGRVAERTTANASATAAELNTGFYTLNANVVSVSFKAQW